MDKNVLMAVGENVLAAVALAVALAVGSAAGLAQEPVGSLRPGETVRLSAPALHLDRETGTVVSPRPDSLVLRLYDSRRTVTVPYDAMAKLSVLRGRKSGTVPGALIGGLVGLGLGTAMVLEVSYCSGFLCGPMSTSDVVGVLSVGTAAGAGLGALIGSTFHADTWRGVALPTARGRVRVGVRVGPGLAVVVSMR